MKMQSNIETALRVARESFEKGEYQLAVYALRDYPETEAAGWKNLAWEYCNFNSNGPTESEARQFIDVMSDYVKQNS